MHANLRSLSEDLGVALPNLEAAAKDAQSSLIQVRDAATSYLMDNHVLQRGKATDDLELGLVAFGSLARQELSKGESDFDYAIVSYRPVERPEDIQQYRLAALKAQIDIGFGEPGRSALFGGIVSSSELINRIGLDDDTNRTHTQRMLFLEESVPVIDERNHAITVRSILRRYLVDYQNYEPNSPLHKIGVPRFLLNDAVRYWRTLAVDYQAKRWDELSPPKNFFGVDPGPDLRSPKWGLRYLKLRSTRKLALLGLLWRFLCLTSWGNKLMRSCCLNNSACHLLRALLN